MLKWALVAGTAQGPGPRGGVVVHSHTPGIVDTRQLLTEVRGRIRGWPLRMKRGSVTTLPRSVAKSNLTGRSGQKFLTGQVAELSRPRPVASLVKG